MKLTTQTQVTVDGVMQGNGGATDENRRNGFERGAWALGAGDGDTRTFISFDRLRSRGEGPRQARPATPGDLRPFSGWTTFSSSSTTLRLRKGSSPNSEWS